VDGIGRPRDLVRFPGGWILTHEDPSSVPYFPVWREALCVFDDGTVSPTGRGVLGVARAPNGAAWFDDRGRAFTGSIDALCRREGPVEWLVAPNPFAAFPETELSVWEYVFVSQLRSLAFGQFMEGPIGIAEVDAVSLAVRPDGIVLFSPINAHLPSGTPFGEVQGDNTPELFFRLRPQYRPLDWNDRVVANDPWRREEPLLRFQATIVQHIDAMAFVPGGTAADDWEYFGQTPPPPWTPPAPPADAGPADASTPPPQTDEGCGCQSSRPAPSREAGVELGAMIAAIGWTCCRRAPGRRARNGRGTRASRSL
jgi:hypothetical protein